MTPAESILAYAATVALLATLAGLLVRGGFRLWYAFTLYPPVMAAFTLTFLLRPSWYRPVPYLLQMNVVNVVRLAMALELAGRTFRAFPGARSTLRATLLVLLLAILLVVMGVPTSTNDYRALLTDMQPRLLNGTVWIFTAIAVLILWYRLPVAALHKSILMPYVPFLLWDAVFFKAFLPHAWNGTAMGYFNQAIYLALVSHWAWVAWRVDVRSKTTLPDPSSDEQAFIDAGG
jgi:hypothetical protein